MVAINEKYIPRKADKSGPQNPTVAWQGKQGYQFEQPLGLQYVRQRWYDPAMRQFISPDPLGLPDATVPWGIESGQVSGGDVNLYRYTGNNPVNRNDPGGTALEYIGNSLYWKVHPGETTWGVAQKLTSRGASYSKIFQRPPGGFRHLHPGELLAVNPTDVGLIANDHWIAEPARLARPTVYVANNPDQRLGAPWLPTSSCIERAMDELLRKLELARMHFGIDVARDEAQFYSSAAAKINIHIHEAVFLGAVSLGVSAGVDLAFQNFAGGAGLKVLRSAEELSGASVIGPLFESAAQSTATRALVLRFGMSATRAAISGALAAYVTVDLIGRLGKGLEQIATGIIANEGIRAGIELASGVVNDLIVRAQALAGLDRAIINATVALYQARLLRAFGDFRRELAHCPGVK